MSESICSGRLDGSVALITGSTRGIGAGVAKRLAAEEASIVVSGRTEAKGESVVDGGRAAVMEDDAFLDYASRSAD